MRLLCLVTLLTGCSAFRASPCSARQRAPAPQMGLFDMLPGFWQAPIPEGYARASHILILATEYDAEATASAVLQRVKSGLITFSEAARQFSACPTRDQLPPGDLGTFASLSQMANIEEMRTFEGIMALPYENQDTRAFDDAVFSVPLNEPQLVESQWGYHLILVTARGGGPRAAWAPAGNVAVNLSADSAPASNAGSAW